MAAAVSPSTAPAPAATPAPKPREPLSVTLRKAGWRALGGGLSGGAAMVVQVLTLMPMRTTMNFQYRYGMSTVAAFKKLKADGGFVRFYRYVPPLPPPRVALKFASATAAPHPPHHPLRRGLAPALIQAPLSRFGDTAANAGALALFDSFDSTASLPVAVKTVGASIAAASLRVLLVPVDTVKTIMQVEGKGGMAALSAKVAKHGPSTLFHGALASAAATFAGHYPWFATFNTLNGGVARPAARGGRRPRGAGLGFRAPPVGGCVGGGRGVVGVCALPGPLRFFPPPPPYTYYVQHRQQLAARHQDDAAGERGGDQLPGGGARHHCVARRDGPAVWRPGYAPHGQRPAGHHVCGAVEAAGGAVEQAGGGRSGGGRIAAEVGPRVFVCKTVLFCASPLLLCVQAARGGALLLTFPVPPA